jgi:pantothenate kinase
MVVLTTFELRHYGVVVYMLGMHWKKSYVKFTDFPIFLLGLNFFITEIPYEVFTYSETNPMQFEQRPQDLYPYMVCRLRMVLSS